MLARSCGRGYVPGNEGSPRRMVQYMLLLVACTCWVHETAAKFNLGT